jgi:hypothetical protein
MPAFKTAGKALARQGIQTGSNILTDVLGGENIKRAALKRAREGGQQLLQQALVPSAPKKSKKKRKKKVVISTKKRKKSRGGRDIFSA